MIAAGLLAVSVISFEMLAPVLGQEAAPRPPAPGEQSAPPPPVPPPISGAQQPEPPAPPDPATQATSTSVHGTVSQYMMNPEVRQPISANGTIKVLTHAARGEIDGAVLDNGTIVQFPPPVGTQYANFFQIGAPLAAVGYGTSNTYGRSLEATSIGPYPDHLQTVTAIDDGPRRGPGERPRPIPAPAG